MNAVTSSNVRILELLCDRTLKEYMYKHCNEEAIQLSSEKYRKHIEDRGKSGFKKHCKADIYIQADIFIDTHL